MNINDEDSIFNYELPVHSSLTEKEQLFGIGEKAFYLIVLVTLILCSLVSIYCILVGIIALIMCRFICKKDPYTLDFLFENLSESDSYEG